MRNPKWKMLMALIFLWTFHSGCSAILAVTGDEEPNLGMIRVGQDKGVVMAVLGNPVSITTNENNQRVETYEFETGNEPDLEWATRHLVFDALTFGMWEAVATERELSFEKHAIDVTYDKEDRVASFSPARKVKDCYIKC